MEKQIRYVDDRLRYSWYGIIVVPLMPLLRHRRINQRKNFLITSARMCTFWSKLQEDSVKIILTVKLVQEVIPEGAGGSARSTRSGGTAGAIGGVCVIMR